MLQNEAFLLVKCIRRYMQNRLLITLDENRSTFGEDMSEKRS